MMALFAHNTNIDEYHEIEVGSANMYKKDIT
jgi:hypothetical protein